MKRLRVPALFAAALLGLALVALLKHVLQPSAPTPPASIEEAGELVKRAGLHWYNGTVSLAPLTEEQQVLLHVQRPAEEWRGIAKIYNRPQEKVVVAEHLLQVLWGDKLVVVGDPELVRRIIALR